MVHASADILLVEDDRVDLMTVERALKGNAITNPLRVARTADEALALLRERCMDASEQLPALILLDLSLPQMNAIELLRHLREDPCLRDLRVIVLTSSNQIGERAAALRLDVEDYLVKPPRFDEFAVAINALLKDLLDED